MIRNDAEIGAGVGVVLAALAGERPAGLGVAAVELKRGPVERALDIEPEILALEKQAAGARRSFGAVDLGVRDICDRAGRQDRRRIDSQLRTVAERQCAVSRRPEQEFGVSADMQGIKLVLPELIGQAPEGADLLREAGRTDRTGRARRGCRGCGYV